MPTHDPFVPLPPLVFPEAAAPQQVPFIPESVAPWLPLVLIVWLMGWTLSGGLGVKPWTTIYGSCALVVVIVLLKDGKIHGTAILALIFLVLALASIGWAVGAFILWKEQRRVRLSLEPKRVQDRL